MAIAAVDQTTSGRRTAVPITLFASAKTVVGPAAVRDSQAQRWAVQLFRRPASHADHHTRQDISANDASSSAFRLGRLSMQYLYKPAGVCVTPTTMQ